MDAELLPPLSTLEKDPEDTHLRKSLLETVYYSDNTSKE